MSRALPLSATARQENVLTSKGKPVNCVTGIRILAEAKFYLTASSFTLDLIPTQPSVRWIPDGVNWAKLTYPFYKVVSYRICGDLPPSDIDSGQFTSFYIVMCILITRQRLAKHISAEANARNNRTFIATQRLSKQACLTIEGLVFHGVRAEWL
jgi:hypothetical protein